MIISPQLPPASAASIAATDYAQDFERLGATKVSASDTGLDLEFVTPDAARMARAIVRDSIAVGPDDARTEVPVRIAGVPEVPAVGVEDALAAIRLLPEVILAGTTQNGLLVQTWFDEQVPHVHELLRPRIADRDVVVQKFIAPGGTGWGSGGVG